MPGKGTKKKRAPRRRAANAATTSAGLYKPVTKRGRLLTGTVAGTGETVRFRQENVKVIELKSTTGEVVGISYPSKANDPVKVPKWAGKTNLTSDTRYVRDYTKGATRNQARFTVAPWGTARRPFYVHAHAGPNTFAITLKTDKKVRIDGDTHGRLLSSNTHFQQASGRTNPRPVVYMSCKSGSPTGVAAANSSQFLHGSGTKSTIYAPTGSGVRNTRGDSSFYGVKTPPGGGTGEFKAFPPNA
jgi:hypothetical protein